MKLLRSILTAGLALALVHTSAHAEIFPLFGDTAGSPVTGKISKGTNAAKTLTVSGKSTVFLDFQMSSSGLTSAQVSSARLTLYLAKVTKPGTLSLSTLTSGFDEGFITATAANPTAAAAFGTLAVTPAVNRDFVIVDVTTQVKAWLENPGTEHGFALASDGTLALTLASKEGAASGHPAELEIDLAIPDGSIAGTQLADGAVTTVKIANLAVGTTQIAGDAITGLKIADGAITTAKINDTAVTSAKLNDGAVTTAKIASQAVGTTEIAGGAITGPKIADGSVNSTKLTSGAVQNGNIANSAVNTAQLADGAITTGKLNDTAVTTAKLNDGAVTAAKLNLLSGNVGIGAATPLAPFHVRTGADENLLVRPGAEIGHVEGIGIQSVNNANTLNAPLTLTASEFAILDGNVGIGTTAPSFRLDVNGGIRCIGAVNTSSDARFKTDIRPVSDALETIGALRGVSYEWNHAAFPEKNFSPRRSFGFIAQEVEKVLPYVVTKDAEGYYSVSYSEVIPVLVEATKELRAENAALAEKLAAFDRQLAALKTEREARTVRASLDLE